MDIKSRFLAAKRAAFDRIFDHLNEKQREAVYTVNGPLLILAGAGSGKTTVLVNRIGYMIRYGDAYASERVPAWLTEDDVASLEGAPALSKGEAEALLDRYAEDRVKAWSILSITFTNKAANEMKSRLEKKVGEDAAAIWAGTFHSVCAKLLRMFGDRIGYSREFTIYDTDDQKKLMISVIREMGVDEKMFQPKAVLNFISRAKDRLMSPADVSNEAADFRESKMAEIYKKYQSRLVLSNALDFDDIIMQTVRLLKEVPEALEYCQNKFRYICVDEYQDTNHAQFVLTSMISARSSNIMVVGDDDQSIYRFRGADIENILNFDKEIKNTRVIKLEQNYRSTKAILDVANSIIGKNINRHGKRLWTEKTEGSKVSLRRLDTQNDESKYIVDKILELRAQGYSLNDFAVLYRLNALSNTLETAFNRMGVPYRVLGGLRFHERKEIKDILAYLCLINNTSDNIRLMRIINEPKRKIGESTVKTVADIADFEGVSMFEIMSRAASYTALSKVAGKLGEFVNLILDLKKTAETEPLDTLIDKVLDRTGYRAMLKAQDEAEGKSRLENAEELISNAVEFISSHEDSSLSAFLEEMALVADIDNYDPDAEAVVLMTVHSAKGLEFPVAIIPGLEEGIFPGLQAMNDPAELEEERRLAYVAITRAKKELFIFRSGRRLLYGRTQYNPVSRFVQDIPAELVDEKVKKPEKASEYSWGNYSSGHKTYIGGGSSANMRPVQKYGAPAQRPAAQKTVPAKKPSVVFAPGDRVKHLAFGEGQVLSAKQMGSDIMYEVMFDTVGTKKLMATYAKLTKIN